MFDACSDSAYFFFSRGRCCIFVIPVSRSDITGGQKGETISDLASKNERARDS